jgi:hypothetical protein
LFPWKGIAVDKVTITFYVRPSAAVFLKKELALLRIPWVASQSVRAQPCHLA